MRETTAETTVRPLCAFSIIIGAWWEAIPETVGRWPGLALAGHNAPFWSDRL